MSEIYAILYYEDGHLTDKRFQKLYDKIKKLENICVNSIREELKLDKINLKKVSDYDDKKWQTSCCITGKFVTSGVNPHEQE